MPRFTDNHRRKQTERTLAGVSDANRPLIKRYLQSKQAEGLKDASLLNVAIALAQLDRATNATPLLDATPDQIRTAILEYARTRSVTSVNNWATQIRGFYRHHHDGEPPKALMQALRRTAHAAHKDTKPITETEFRTLLETVVTRFKPRLAAKWHALLWVLWDTGMRIGEVLSLRVNDYHPDQQGGAELTLPPSHIAALPLKTGPRSVYVVECAGAIQTWLQVHPNGTDPEALIFPGKGSLHTPRWPQSVNTQLNKLCEEAGLRKVNPHLFRHTRATRAAISGWNEPQMRAYFGWSPGSTMPSLYIHLSQRNMADRVRKDAGIDELGYRTQTTSNQAGLTDDALEKRLKQALRRMLLDPDP